MNKKIYIVLVVIFLAWCNNTVNQSTETSNPTSSEPSTYVCDRTYDETARVLQSSSPSYLNYDKMSGKISIEPAELKTRNHSVIHSMNRREFFEMCSPGKSSFGSAACPYYIKCVSEVVHNKLGKKGDLDYMSFEGVATVIREELIESGSLKASKIVPHPYATKDKPLKNVDNFVRACDSVSSTYSGAVVAATIFQNVPEVPDFNTAMILGKKAVKGYGECRCVLSNYTGLHEVISIGKCKGDRFFSY